MKKLLLLLLIAPMIVNSQQTRIFDININGLNFIGLEDFHTLNHDSIENEITIPDDEYWLVFHGLSNLMVLREDISFYGYIPYSQLKNNIQKPYNGQTQDYYHYNPLTNLFEGGTKFFFDDAHPDYQCNDCIVRVFKYETTKFQNSLSYNEPETIKNNSNTPVLFPNPTSSLLALNSDKEYDIEVYDMAGNKVVALTGNTIDMSHLSSATYIVKALDKVENEEVSYKVVKN